MTTFDIGQYWWLLPLLMMLLCFVFCRKGCGCRRRSNRDEPESRTLQKP